MESQDHKPKQFITGGWGARHTLAFMGFLGFVLAYSMRFNLSLAIVSMVDHSHVRNNNANSKTGSLPESSAGLEVCPNVNQESFSNLTDKSINDIATSITRVNNSIQDGKFYWTEAEQGLILGCFFFGYVITQYPGGKLSHMYGAKWIFSVGLLITGILSIALPFVTMQWGKTGLVIIRVCQGLAEGVTFPAMHVIIAKWSPREEISRITNMIFSGIPIGTAVTMVTGGYLISYFGWPSLFYSVGVLSIIWFIFWSFLVYEELSDHPRITVEEKNLIESGMHASKEHQPTPWKAIFTSSPVWAIIIVHIFHTYGHYLLHVEVPKYLHAVHGFNIEQNGWFSALPQVLNFCMCIAISNFSDFLIVKEWTSASFTRKLCATIALWGSAAAFSGMIFGGCNTKVALTCLNIAGCVLGAGYGAWIVNNIEIAPNHAGTIIGLSNSVSNILGFFTPYISGLILHTYPNLFGWRIVFAIPTVLNFTINIVYLIFARSEEMSWNRPKPKSIPP